MYPKINDGDLVIIRKQPQPDYQGQTCLVVHDSTAKIKNLIYNSENQGSAVLLSISSDILPEEVKSDELTVHGVVKYIISRNKS
jgi:SOS-response transcriptional repressor LexA